MSEYTPTIDEVRWAYGDARCVDPDDPTHARGCPQDAEFDRWLAEVERAAAARALEEAADEIYVPHGEIFGLQRDAFNRGADAVYEALRARAAEMREGKSND